MSYIVLNESLQVKGRLSLSNGQGNTAFFGDTVVQQIATENSNTPTNLLSVAFNQVDKQGNAKQWNHTLTLNIEATELGTSIGTRDYIMYYDDVSNHYYLMKVLSASSDRNSGYVNVSAINAAIYELGKQIITKETVYKQINLMDFVKKAFNNAPFSLRVKDDNLITLDYTISANTSLQALLQDLQTKFNVDVDSWVELDAVGGIQDRVLYFGNVGTDNGELIRYGGAKGFENMTATEVSDIIYTKLYVTGKTDDKDPNKGHIGSINNGMEYIVDDDANRNMYAIGASQQKPVYLEGAITNTILSEPQALLDWAKEQMAIFNHPRFNYTVNPLHDQIVALGDKIAVQDFHIKPEILITSRVIQKTTSFASPENNTFVLGEFSSIFTDSMNKSANVVNLIKKDVTVVQEAADYAKAQADAAHAQAVIAQEQAIHAQTSADGKTTTYTGESESDLPEVAKEGDGAWIKSADGDYHYVYLDGKWKKDIYPDMGKDIAEGVKTAVEEAGKNADKAIADNQIKTDASIKSVNDKAEQLKADQSVFDAKAQGYANQAKSDAIANTASAVQESSNNAANNLAQARTDLTQSITQESTDRQNAVNALDTKAQGYANQAKADAIASSNTSIQKEATDRQSALSALNTKTINAINSARSDAQSALNALQVGGRNLFAWSKTLPWDFGSNSNATVTVEDFDANTKMYHIKSDKGHGKSAGMYIWGFCTDRGLPKGSNWSFSADIKGTGYINNFGAEGSTNVVTKGAIGTDWSRLSQSGVANNADHISLIMYFDTDKSALDVYIKLPKLEIGNMPTAYTQAPEDIVQDYTNRDNQITQSFTQYQQTNDGKVSKAQSDATQSLNLVATKVSQTDYDAKTGDLDTKYTNVKQTVDSQTTEIADIKQTATDQSAKINTISSDVDGTKQTISDIQTAQGKQSGSIATLESRADGFDATITKVNTTVDSLGQINQLVNTEFSPDFAGWSNGNQAPFVVDGSYSGSVRIRSTFNSKGNRINSILVPVSGVPYISVSVYNNSWLAIRGYDKDKKIIGELKSNYVNSQTLNTINGIAIPSNVYYVDFMIQSDNNGYVSQPMLVFTTAVGVYVQGNYNNNSATAKAQLTADQATLSINSYKTDADGRISKAQSDIITNANAITSKVSKTDYDQKTGDLSTKINDVKQTADGSAQTIADIQIADGKQDARMTQIESDASGVKTTVSDLQAAQDKQSGSISTLQQRADGFDATVSKVNNLQVGGRNYVKNSTGMGSSDPTRPRVLNDWHNTVITNANYTYDADGITMTVSNPNSEWFYSLINAWTDISATPMLPGKTYTISVDAMGTVPGVAFRLNDAWVGFNPINNSGWTRVSATFTNASDATRTYIRINAATGNTGAANFTAGQTMRLRNFKLEDGNLPTPWTPAPEDVDSATAKAQLTADQATTALSNYKTDADGRISKAQADITATAKQVQTKVSQSDYDQKTGDLSTKVSTAQQTADSANTTIGDYKKANDGRISSAESAIKQNTDAISSKVSQTDYDQKTGKLDGQISTLNQTAKDITTSVSKVSDRIDSFNAPNLFQNSEFETDTGYRNKNGTVTISGTTKNSIDGKYNGTVTVTNASDKGTYLGWWSNRIPVQGGQVYSASVLTHFNQSGSGLALLDIWFVDKDNQRISAAGYSTGNKANPYWVFLKSEGFIAPQNAVNMEVSLLVMNNGDGAQTATFTQPMVTATDKVKPYTPNITDKQFSTQQQKIDSISSIVSDPNTGLTKRVQTAEGFMTSATDRLGKVENKSTSTADGLTREIKDRTDGDSNTLQQGKDFTTSQISNSETGMKSFVNQTISGLQIGAISSDVNTLKLSTQWQTVNVDDLNNMTNQGKFFIQGGNRTNAPVGGWFYLTVDKPINGRITQVAWADSNPTMQYTRILFGSNWSNWNRVVTNETVLSIFNDSWSLGTSTNDGITKQLITGINGQADGTLVLSGKSVILNSDTVIGNNFIIGSANIANGAIGTAQIGEAAITSAKIASLDVSKLTGDTITGFNINANRRIYIASGGSLVSDVVNMDKDSFSVVAPNINSNRVSAQGFNVGTNNGVFNIKSSAGVMSSDGKISVTSPNQSSSYKNGTFHSEYGTNNLVFSATGYDNQDPDEYVNMSSAELDYMYSKTGFLSDATQHTSIRANLIETTGTLNAFSGAQIPSIYSYPNLTLESKNQSVLLKAGGNVILQVRENGYMYMLTRHSGSGGVSLQVAGDGALFMQSSSTKYKTDIQYDGGTSVGDKFLTLDPATWQDKGDYEQRKLYREQGIEPDHQIHMDDKRYYGLIAEDLVKAGLEEFVVRDENTGEVEGLEYDKVAISLIPVVREQRNAINELRTEIERLKEKV